MKKAQRDVLAFCESGGHFVQKKGPRWPEKGKEAGDANLGAAWKMVLEEFEELKSAFHARDLVDVADGAADLIWVVFQLCIRLGIYLPPVWDEVAKTNMAKLNDGKPILKDGKIQKPEGWKPPDIRRIIAKQIELAEWLSKNPQNVKRAEPPAPSAPDDVMAADGMG